MFTWFFYGGFVGGVWGGPNLLRLLHVDSALDKKKQRPRQSSNVE